MTLLQALTHYENPQSLGSRLRRRRARHVVELIETSHRHHGRCRIIDIGGRRSYWNAFDLDYLRSRGCTILLVNTDYIDKDDDIFSSVIGDGCDLEGIDAGAFDLAHSNSTIEHVGGWDRVEAFAHEIARVAPRYFVQTPNFWFPIEPHFGVPFFHWLPETSRAAMLMRRGLGHYRKARSFGEAMRHVQGARLLDRRAMRFLFPVAEIRDEYFCGLTKSLMAIKH